MTENHPYKIMVVEDEAVIALRLKQVLTTMGYDVVGIAYSGEEAIKKAKSLNPELILMDIMIPDKLDGIAAAKIITAEFDIPIVFLTAFSEDRIIERAKQVGPYGYILKPFQDHEVKATIEVALYKKEMENILKENENKFRALAENANDGVLIASGKGEYVYANKRAGEITGYSVSELLKLRINDLAHPDEIEPIMDNYYSTISENSFQKQHETRIFHKDGKEIPIEVTIGRTSWEEQVAVIILFRDITELKQADEQLRESEENYRRLFKSLVDVFYQADNSGKITMVSPSITRVAGYKPEEVIGTYLKDYYVYPDERNKFLELISTNGFVENFEVQMKKKDGSFLWASVYASLSKDQEGKVVGIEGIARDITKRIKAEEELRRSEERFRNMAETTSDWIWEIDKNGRYIYASPKVYDILGYRKEEIIGKTPFDFMPPDQADRVSKIFNRIIASKESFDCLENINLHNDGHLVVLETSGIPTFDSNGKFSGYRGIDRDITGRKEIENTLRESEERYRVLAENSKVGFWQTTLDGRTIYINPAMCRMLEVENSEEVLGRPFCSFFNAENQKIIKRELTKREKGLSSTYEIEFIGKEGTKYEAIVTGAPIHLSEDNIHSTIATFTDITGLKKIEKELIKAREELEHKVEDRTAELSNALEIIIQSEKELLQHKFDIEKVNKELLETNQALSILARNIDRGKELLENKVHNTIMANAMPVIIKLQNNKNCQRYLADLEVLKFHLNSLLSDGKEQQDIITLLTEQEMKVAALINKGLNTQQIGHILYISEHTVKTHRKNIRKKLKIKNSSINLKSYLKSKLK